MFSRESNLNILCVIESSILRGKYVKTKHLTVTKYFVSCFRALRIKIAELAFLQNVFTVYFF